MQLLSAADLARDGAASLTAAMNFISSININDAADDPSPARHSVSRLRGFPVLGTPIGLAVYQNGVRINEAFGDTVNWDLFPDVAINRVELVSSSPVYGLNALGGAISLSMKNGFDYQGTDLELSGGSYGLRSAAAQFGADSGPFGFYVAGRALDSTGWRQFSEDRIRQLYAVVSAHLERASFDLSYTRWSEYTERLWDCSRAGTAVNRSLVFTGPQNNLNTLDFLTLNGNAKMTDSWSLQSVLYYRQYAQSVANGNTTNYTALAPTP